MAINKVNFGNRTLIDISDSTLTADDLLEGLIAYNKAGERIIGNMAQIIIDDAMSDTSENAVMNKVIKAYIDAHMGADLISMFEIAMADEYDVEDESEAPAVISKALKLDGFVSPIGTSAISWKKPTVTISDIEWETTVNDNYDIVGTGTVTVHFGSAGSLSKTVNFKKHGEGKLYAVRLSDASAIIDTGIQGDYSHRFHVKGHTIPGTPSVLMGAFVSTAARGEARFLGGSNKAQIMFPGNMEVTSAASGKNVYKMFEATYGANYFSITQDGMTYTPTISGHTTSGAIGATVTILSSRAGGYGDGIICYGEHLDSDNTVLGYYAPYQLHDGEIVILNTAGLTAQQIFDIVQNGDSSSYADGRIRRPSKGTLISVTQAEDESA